jgi:Winged helix DNA-binding domain
VSAAPANHDLLGERFARHGFGDRPARTPAAAADRTCGLQAQDLRAGRLAVRSRSAALTDANVADAIERRTLVRSSLMRATVHLVPAADLRWLTSLLGPVIARSFATRWRQLGLTPAVLRRARAVLPDALAGGPHSRVAVVDRLAQLGVRIARTGQAPAHLLLFATTEGLVCRTPDRGREAHFALIDEWLPDSPAGPSGDDALAEIARRYFRAFSPATAADFTAWSGLPSGRAVGLIRDELTPADVNGRPGYRLGEVAPQRGVRLLAMYDNYLIGYRDRDEFIDSQARPTIYVGGVIKPAVLLDGRVAGVWKLVRARQRALIQLTPFGELSRRTRDALEAEAADVGRFLDLATELKLS